MKLIECPQCKGNILEKDVEEIYGKKTVLVHVEECQKCGEKYTAPGEYQRIFEILHPPFSQKLRRVLHMPVSYLRKFAL